MFHEIKMLFGYLKTKIFEEILFVLRFFSELEQKTVKIEHRKQHDLE